tara:strand:+ start:362 stop:787 length:426 start_codon:yes stop_codon:yes gene_type:complete
MNSQRSPTVSFFRVVLFVHGSRNPEWAIPFEELRERTAKQLGSKQVRLAYLEFNTPTLLDIAREASSDGIQTLLVVPLFFGGGQHMRVDVPDLVAEASRENQNLDIRTSGPLSEDQVFCDALLNRVLKLAEPLKEGGSGNG